MESTWDRATQFVRETAMLGAVESALAWDERTYLPAGGGGYRAEQLGLLARMLHQRRTDPQLGEWLAELAAGEPADDPHQDRSATIRLLKRDFDKQSKLPATLVEELAKTSVLSQQIWVEARQSDDFASFAPSLDKLVRLKREQAEAIGYDDHIYDAVLDDFDQNERTANVRQVLDGLREELVPLVAAIRESSANSHRDVLQRDYPIPTQAAIGQRAAEAIGFDFNRGRLDVTTHPFCTTLGPDDVRLTTRYEANWLPGSLFGTLHEAGHGIYEQGLRGDQFGLPPGSATSLSIHESQSRMWENQVGRSREFWEFYYPEVQQAFPAALSDVPLDDFYFAINDVRPSLIRVEADEATYNLHIIIRFELEQELLTDQLPVADLPAAWNERYEQYLGITPPNATDGVLQDIHWSAALIGYFPTYSLGNLYAAQLFAQADDDLGGLAEAFRGGQFDGLRTWLNERVHHPGQCFTSAELVERVTGASLSHEPLMAYLRGKLEPLYGLS